MWAFRGRKHAENLLAINNEDTDLQRKGREENLPCCKYGECTDREMRLLADLAG